MSVALRSCGFPIHRKYATHHASGGKQKISVYGELERSKVVRGSGAAATVIASWELVWAIREEQ